ncbi:TPA: ribonuclease [Bacillus nitratireducens]|uniref:ribonuclease n=1 Tax=Bacillus paranthracis TaxID=2026186 RepID=UPI000977307B|nr:ribonuclease [Bacillus paranthracis]MCC2412589.1 ribonuclease [Bacillus paranthracis]MCC2440761.1 ribonuclease [Bacillus paranthracis]ONG78243.1 ribonuclease [Bacillus cereus]
MKKFFKFGCLGIIAIFAIIIIAVIIDVSNDDPKSSKTAKETTQANANEPKQQEKAKDNTNLDKTTYENEIKPTIDAMIKEYDDIWNQEWKPIWDKASQDPASIDKDTLKEKMELVMNKYDELSNKNSAFKPAEKLSDSALKEKIEKFRVEFGLAVNYRSNAGRAVNQGVKGVAPMKDRMEEAKKSIQLSDKKLINATANLVEVETKLGIQRN